MNRVVSTLAAALPGLTLSAILLAAVPEDQPWQTETSSDGSTITARHETGGVAVDGKLYVFGGRRTRPVEMYDPATDIWSELGPMPGEFNHFQPVAIGSDVYLIGGFDSSGDHGFPHEKNIAEIYRYDTLTRDFAIVGEVPANRRRGSAAAVAHDGWIYVVGGNNQGHSGGAVDWFDRWNPVSGEWDILPDAPSARDHAQAVVIDDKLVIAGGRRTSSPNVFANPVMPTEIYDFASGEWRSGQDIPTARAGAVAAAWDGEMLVAGGEINTSNHALAKVEAYNVASDEWRTLQPLDTGRHSAAAAILGQRWHLVAGSVSKGGGSETTSHESLLLGDLPPPDSDEDGLPDQEEIDTYQTDPEDADTDDDGLSDSEEVTLGSNPLLADSDSDGLADGEEQNRYGTDPNVADSDGDTLTDGAEVHEHDSDPLLADSDDDGLDDALEVALGSNPKAVDSDDDTLSDADEYRTHGTSPTRADSDADGLSDADEIHLHRTDPLLADSDADDLSDADEIRIHHSDPRLVDSDGDGLADGVEVNEHGSNPAMSDTDGDSLDDGREVLELGTSPVKADTDDDGMSDTEDPAPLVFGDGRRRGGAALWLLLMVAGSGLLRRVK
ncbi:MAG: hypothetical protein CSB44_11050 [Gammaproteobacteria bacterium]|nr:MAG: hypothetical protein CSB44_11050 [Gammaproteobacteria bacterium]